MGELLEEIFLIWRVWEDFDDKEETGCVFRAVEHKWDEGRGFEGVFQGKAWRGSYKLCA